MPVAAPRLARAAGLYVCGLGIAFSPLVAPWALAVGPMHDEDWLPLTLLALVLLVGGLTLRRVGSPRLLALLVLPVALLSAELGARLVLAFMPAARLEAAALSAVTYRDGVAYRAHPFLQFVGQPQVALRGTEVFGNLPQFNEDGFVGELVAREKPEGTLRIVCLGGSTTARGYPDILQRHLREALGEERPVEVVNLGVGFWTSAHSVVNLVLNALDYAPDYVVFHHAWNDWWGRDTAAPVRGDYTHFLKPFEMPPIPDALAIRGSVIYRYCRDRWFPTPGWLFVANAAVDQPVPRRPGERFDDVAELWPYRRNLRTFVDVARGRGIVPVLVTMPYSTDPSAVSAEHAPHIAQCNAVMRDLVADHGEGVVFVDLDAQVTGRHNDQFLDLGHFVFSALPIKARAIGGAILEHLRRE